jgi:predicted nucleotidyltransferase
MINTYKLKLTNLQQGILRLFFIKAGKSLNARDIARALKVSQPAVAKALPFLEKSGFLKIKKDKESGRWVIELKIDSQEVIWLKRSDNLKQVYESGFVKFLYDTFPGATIILFGSYAFGEDTVNSDIDLAIIGLKEKNINLKTFEEILGREIFIHYYNSFKVIDKDLKDNILNGIVLKGAIEL